MPGIPGMPLAKGVGGLLMTIQCKFGSQRRVLVEILFFLRGEGHPTRKNAQNSTSWRFISLLVFTIWLAKWVMFTLVFWNYVPMALAIQTRMPVWNCSIILSKWHLHLVAQGNLSHSHSLRNDSQTYHLSHRRRCQNPGMMHLWKQIK